MRDDHGEATDAPSAVDLRSDTVTRPTEAMYARMRSAPLGDDGLDADPTARALEETAAARLKELENILKNPQQEWDMLVQHSLRPFEPRTQKVQHRDEYQQLWLNVVYDVLHRFLPLSCVSLLQKVMLLQTFPVILPDVLDGQNSPVVWVIRM